MFVCFSFIIRIDDPQIDFIKSGSITSSTDSTSSTEDKVKK